MFFPYQITTTNMFKRSQTHKSLSKHQINSFLYCDHIYNVNRKIGFKSREAATKWFHWKETLWLVNLRNISSILMQISINRKNKMTNNFQLTLASASDSIVTYLGRDQSLQESPSFELHWDFNIPRDPKMPPENCCIKLDYLPFHTGVKFLTQICSIYRSDLLIITSNLKWLFTNIRSRLRDY